MPSTGQEGTLSSSTESLPTVESMDGRPASLFCGHIFAQYFELQTLNPIFYRFSSSSRASQPDILSQQFRNTSIGTSVQLKDLIQMFIACQGS